MYYPYIYITIINHIFVESLFLDGEPIHMKLTKLPWQRLRRNPRAGEAFNVFNVGDQAAKLREHG